MSATYFENVKIALEQLFRL